MSTILKALKRIDQTSPPPDDLQQWPAQIDTKETVRGRVNKIRLYRKAVLALILIIIIIAGWLAYNQKQWLTAKLFPQKTSAKNPIYQAKIEQAPVASQDAGPEKAPPIIIQDARPETADGRRATVGDQRPRGLPRFPASQKIQKNPIYPSSDNLPAPGKDISAKANVSRPPPAADSTKPAQRDTRTRVAVPESQPAPQAAPAVRSYRRLDDSKLKLQAIAWSKDAAQRIAVINGHIVREGESVDGFVVNQIRQEDVVVNDGSGSWQLEFGLK